MKGKFIVIDGLDGVGKGVFMRALVQAAKNDSKRVFDVHTFWGKHGHHPKPQDIIGNYDIVITSEPTFVGIGRHIREELIAKNNRKYGSFSVAEAYALDRRILYEQVLIPLLEAGIHVFQSRSFSTSIVYQRQTALDEGISFDVSQILSIPGNAFCLQYPMDYLLIPTIMDAAEAVRRSELRDKDDNCEFENLNFQLKAKEQFEHQDFKSIFTNIGTELVYLDAGISVPYSEQQAKEFYNQKIMKVL